METIKAIINPENGDVRPLIYLWTGIFIIYLGITVISLIRFIKKHPEIKQNTQQTMDGEARESFYQINEETRELLRRYNNKTMVAFCMILVWVVGILLITCIIKISSAVISLIAIVVGAMLLPLLGIRRKK